MAGRHRIFAQQTKDLETRFMGLVKRLKAGCMSYLVRGSEQLTQTERETLHTFLFGGGLD